MNSDLKALLIGLDTQTCCTCNINKLFPHLAAYRDVDGKVVRRGANESESHLERVVLFDTANAPKSHAHGDAKLIQDAASWVCKHCTYQNVPLMVNSLWRFYNKLCECALCGTNRYVGA
eukprot:917378_1